MFLQAGSKLDWSRRQRIAHTSHHPQGGVHMLGEGLPVALMTEILPQGLPDQLGVVYVHGSGRQIGTVC